VHFDARLRGANPSRELAAGGRIVLDDGDESHAPIIPAPKRKGPEDFFRGRKTLASRARCSLRARFEE
jgi:hypothetical protein